MTKGKVIYEPKGPAKEYAHLAVNLYKGCAFGCKYCYAPKIAYMKLDEWSANPEPKKDILKRLEADCKKMKGDPREILLCFTCDPYQSPEAAKLTRKALLILEKYEMTATVLTKGGEAAIQDFDILKRNDWKFGTTLSCMNDEITKQWEPNAALASSRLFTIARAADKGIKTWVSMEPVYNTKQALSVIKCAKHCVDFWKIGKMNHRNLPINWAKFRFDVTNLLEEIGAKYYIKKELRDAK